MAAVEALHRFAQPLADGLRRAGDDITLADEVLPLQSFAPQRRGAADLGEEARANRAFGAIAGRVGEALIDVQAAVVEIIHMFGVVAFGLLVGLGDHYGLR